MTESLPSPDKQATTSLTYADIEAAAAHIDGRVRPVTTTSAPEGGIVFALEFLQHTGTFKARGAQNFIRAHMDAGAFPEAGVTIASGGNAGLACAWAARAAGVPATVFLPTTAPSVKVERLRSYGARVELAGSEFAEAAAACREFVTSSGALASHAYDHPLIAAGAGTLMIEILEQVPDLDTVVVSVGGGGLFAGVATAAAHHGVRTVAVEPMNCQALSAAIEAGEPVDVTVDSVAADSLGARRVTPLAFSAAQSEPVTSVLVEDSAIIAARHHLWDEHRLAVEHAAAAALAGVSGSLPSGDNGDPSEFAGNATDSYVPAAGEKVCVVLCGANTGLSDL